MMQEQHDDLIAASEAVAAPRAATIELLHRQIADADTQWSLGIFGGIAEFSRDHDEPVSLSQSSHGVSAVTARGGIAITWSNHIRPLASESISKTGWSHRVALCLPARDCAMNRRTELTELGSDLDSLRPEDRGAILFDLGLGALQADLCVRVDDPNLVVKLRPHAGRPLFEMGNPAMGMILEANPHRVFMSRIGRIEVYQPIPPASGKSPEGPHTHVLPKLLKSGRTHPATEPIPDGWIPCAHIYPPHSARDELGRPRPFDDTRHEAFQHMLGTYGHPESLAIKRRIMQAIEDGEPPAAMAHDRDGRNSVRIALRQMRAAGQASAVLAAWLAQFDHADPGDEDAHHEAFHD